MLSAQFFCSLLTALVALQLILLVVAYGTLLERKVASWTQDRIGPNRTGFSFGQDNIWKALHLNFLNTFHFWGLGQPLADGLKFIFKEEYTPPHVERPLFLLAPVLAVVPAMLGWAVMPWGGQFDFPGWTIGNFQFVSPGHVTFAAAPLGVGIIYILAVSSLAVYGVVVAGYASNNKYAFLGGLRATAQMLSYEIPLGLCILTVILMTGTVRAGDLVELQAQGVWNLLYQPLLAIIFFTCGLAECNRAPFDLAECEQELVGGFHTEYASMKFALFFMGEYMHMTTSAAFLTLLFLGGWSVSPLGLWPDLPAYTAGWAGAGLVLLKAAVFAVKVLLVIFTMMWVRWTLPRFRFDQLMKLAWRSLIPVTVLLMLATGLGVFFKLSPWVYTAINAGVFVLMLVVGPLIPTGPKVNRRVPLAGSRFSPLSTKA
ncbi:MAG: hypothetical protein GC164_12745 [Phycisphaera sp.]|nr:hypothetical protein [Phycisphaera sp.]